MNLNGHARTAISIHAPRGGSDDEDMPIGDNSAISIHAPRGGSDKIFHRNRTSQGNFNPRSPWGERL